MSHACLLVVTDSLPTNDELTRVLQPWHEFECTGTDDEYVQEIDITDYLRETFAAQTRIMVRWPDGTLAGAYENQFYRDPTPEEQEKIAGTGVGYGMSWQSQDWGDGRGYRTKVRFVPDGCEEVKVPVNQVESFRDFIEGWSGQKPVLFGSQPDKLKTHKHGWVELNAAGDVVRAIDRTNPSKKWDWWQVGGRYSGRLEAGYDPENDPQNRETCRICGGTGRRSDMVVANGCNGCHGTGVDTKWPTEWVQRGNQARWGNLHMDRLLQANRDKQRGWWDDAEADYEKRRGPSDPPYGEALRAYDALYEDVLATTGKEYLSREQIEDHPRLKHLSDLIGHTRFMNGIDRGVYSREDMAAQAVALSAFAVVKDGKWAEKGELGWWGAVAGEKADWQQQLQAILDTIRPDQWVTVVDYHI